MVVRDQVLIGGAAYAVTRTPAGWGVTRTERRIDRIGRSYDVHAGDNGAPVSCSCADWVYRGGVCKHMHAVLDLYLPPSPAAEEQT